MPIPPGYSGPLLTFRRIYNLLNQGNNLSSSGKPGHRLLPGDQWINWIESTARAGTVNLDSQYYDGQPAGAWFQSYVTYAFAHALAKTLKSALNVTKKFPGILTDTGSGIGKVPGGKGAATVFSDVTSGNLAFLQGLTARGLWERIAIGVIGGAIIVVSIAKVAPNTSVGKAAVKAGKSVKIL